MSDHRTSRWFALPGWANTPREEFGLELKPFNGPIDVLMVDYVEKPLPD